MNCAHHGVWLLLLLLLRTVALTVLNGGTLPNG